MTPRLSVVIPAHDEAAVIARTLESALASAEPGEVEVIVVCNGCTDGTAEIARRFPVIVLETEIPSKYNALNLGDERAGCPIHAYLDADTVLTPGALTAVADALERGPALAAAPALGFDLGPCTWAARAYFRIWREAPFVQDRPLGAGFYALSAAGRARFQRFPPIVADDYFALRLFAPHERVTVAGEYLPLLPRSLLSLCRTEVRHYRGFAEFRAWSATNEVPLTDVSTSRGRWLGRLATRPSNWPGLALFVGVKLYGEVVGRAKYRSGRMGTWERDSHSRDHVRARHHPS